MHKLDNEGYTETWLFQILNLIKAYLWNNNGILYFYVLLQQGTKWKNDMVMEYNLWKDITN